MKQLSIALVGQPTNAALEVCKKLTKSFVNFSLLVITFLTFAATGKAATFTVSNLNDTGAGSLRQAVTDANTAAGADTIVFDANIFSQAGRDFLVTTSEITITSDITIEGPQKRSIWVTSNNTNRLVNITGGNVTVNNLTFWRGVVNSADAGGGLRIASGGTVNLNNVTFIGCSAGEGGAIYNAAGTLLITNSTFFGNSATNGRGGAILVNGGNSTVNMTSSTVIGNSATSSGGGLYFILGSLTLRNSLLSANVAQNATEIFGAVNSLGYNLIQNPLGASISGNVVGNQYNVNPLIAGFTSVGGGTWAVQLQKASPAVDAGDPTLANTLDQRNARRNTDGNNNGVAGVDIGAVERQRTSLDFDGEETADLAVLRTSGLGSPLFWYNGYVQIDSRPSEPEGNNLLTPNPNAFRGFHFGLESDIAVPGDYDGDGKTDAAVFRPGNGTWYVNQTTGGFLGFNWGLSGDIPVPADYDGDGKTDFAVVRGNIWYVYKSSQGFTGVVTLGTATDKPVPADYDGDLKADIAVYSNGNWTINRSTGGQTVTSFGLATDIPVPADYDGNGNDNVAVFRPSNGTWFILKPSGGFDSVPFGVSTDKVVPADYDGDGKVDIAVKRANNNTGRSTWYMLLSSGSLQITDFGLNTDNAVANALIRQ